ncbi:HNH endonuclease [Nitrospirillum viridazoti]|uniref:HNH endonuclease n=1 Tax=Nitrospirillum viridazoti CBAmc TaxID=1441467 RepID=A0A248K0U8_9PROT|nr:HNH endonuclease [Nitrospirillum amazonense]ASG24038.1 hypothetical protein Y958_24195 [Nitrospirillum amazonense CBAmc]TWB25983.1 hypothetical protein FBZ91_1496 [Nitrospirillum amazonense]
MKPYSHARWHLYREEVIKLDGACCVRCRRGRADGAVLQVHHKAYVSGRLPWEYPYGDCETLCKGCHAAEHGIAMPKTGWSLFGVDDLGSLCGSCELCGTEIRYIYAVGHPSWGAMGVGTDCCDALTATTDAGEHHANLIKEREKKRRFVDSPKWKVTVAGDMAMIRDRILVQISPYEGHYRLKIGNVQGVMKYPTVLDAKIRAFEFIESGDAAKFIAERRSLIRIVQ